jgi:hypothetical protein
VHITPASATDLILVWTPHPETMQKCIWEPCQTQLSHNLESILSTDFILVMSIQHGNDAKMDPGILQKAAPA